MFKAVPDPYLVPFDGSFRVKDADTEPPRNAPDKKERRELMDEAREAMRDLQRVLYAHNRYALLLVFQAMDAAGKDGTVRAVMSGVNPAGCQVYSFKQPSAEELDHDFLWRTARCLPERGRIGIFNRSYYEEVLVVRVHPEYLGAQRLPYPVKLPELWKQRYRAIRDHERHLAESGTVILKFWLNVSPEEQKQRFLDRIHDPTKNWKFSDADIAERGFWKEYMAAYEEALAETSREWAPWYAIPADHKPYMRLSVARIIVNTLKSLDLEYPSLGDSGPGHLEEMRRILESE